MGAGPSADTSAFRSGVGVFEGGGDGILTLSSYLLPPPPQPFRALLGIPQKPQLPHETRALWVQRPLQSIFSERGGGGLRKTQSPTLSPPPLAVSEELRGGGGKGPQEG